MEAVMTRIFQVMEELQDDPQCGLKAYILGQIAGNITKGENVWRIMVSSCDAGEMLADVLDEIHLDYKELKCEDGIFIITIA